MSTYTPLHDVNVTSIYSNTRTHILIFYIRQIYLLISGQREGRNRCGFLPPYSSFRSKIHIYSCSQHILMTTITPTTSIKSSISFYSKSIKVFQNTDLSFNKSYLLPSCREREKLMLRFQKRTPSSLHTTRKVAQKDPIFPP